jgi:hypothetical protein
MLAELARVARERIIFQHWYLPINRCAEFKKSPQFRLTEAAIWQPRTYFGRVNVITVVDFIQASCDLLAIQETANRSESIMAKHNTKLI